LRGFTTPLKLRALTEENIYQVKENGDTILANQFATNIKRENRLMP
jgi:hypothetical protein